MREPITLTNDHGETMRIRRSPTARPRTVSPEDIIEQRRQGWPDMHPEDYCHRCGTRNVQSWSVDPDLWQTVTENMDRGMYTVLCPQCFTEAWEAQAHRQVTWVLSIDPNTTAEGDEVERLREALRLIAEAGPFTRNPVVQVDGEDFGPAEYAEMVLNRTEPTHALG